MWASEDGKYTEFVIIESRFEGKDLTTVQELQDSQRAITKEAAKYNMQAKINLAQTYLFISKTPMHMNRYHQ